MVVPPSAHSCRLVLPKNDCACFFKLGDHSGIEVGYPIFEDFGTGSGAHSARGDVVLDGEWNSVKRPAIFSLSDFLFRFLSLRLRIFRRNRHISVKKRIQPLDTPQGKTRQFNRRKLALFDIRGHIDNREIFEIFPPS